MFSIIQAAGWRIWFLLLASVIVVALILERAIALRRTKVLPTRLPENVTGSLRRQPLPPDRLAQLDRSSPLGRILAAGLRASRIWCEALKGTAEQSGRPVAHDFERYPSALGTIATAAPLPGLFGTVIGTIEAFGAQGQQDGPSDPQQLAHGISVMLYDTTFGLVAAIPAQIAHRAFHARVDGCLGELELHAARLVDAAARGRKEPLVLIQAAAAASRQSVVAVLEAVRTVGLGRVTFSTQTAS